MPKERVRTHISAPKEVIDAIDAAVGRRCRSKFFIEAAEEKLSRSRLISAARKAAGSLADVDIPGWETSESAAEWVRASRHVED